LLDPSAVMLNSITVVISFWLAGIGYKIGKATGFVSFWQRVTKGWILVGIGRVTMALAEADVGVNPNAIIDLRDVGLIVILIAVCFMVWGFNGLLKEMTERSKIGS